MWARIEHTTTEQSTYISPIPPPGVSGTAMREVFVGATQIVLSCSADHASSRTYQTPSVHQLCKSLYLEDVFTLLKILNVSISRHICSKTYLSLRMSTICLKQLEV